MSTGLLERVEAPAEAEATPDEHIDHVVCHCDLDKGWCGAAATGEVSTFDESSNPCKVCEALLLKYDEVCPNGCDCPASMRFFYCGIDDMYDEEDED